MSKEKQRITVEEFSEWLNRRWNERIRKQTQHLRADGVLQLRDYVIPGMGLMGEAGEAGEHFKKFIRDGKPVFRNRKLALELGDVLHYLCRCADLAGYSLHELIALNQQKIARRERKGVKHT